MPKKSMRFELYSIHAHLETGSVDYADLFSIMSSLRGHHHHEGRRQVAVGQAVWTANRLFLVAYTGYSEKSLLFFDVKAKAELTESTTPGRFQAHKTYALIDAQKRLLLIETKRGNLHPWDLATVIENQARKFPKYKSLDLVFNPIADPEFIKRLDDLTRIQAATVTIARPNPDWTDRYNELTKVADESNARALDVSARSKRGKSLSRDAGLLQFIRHSAKAAHSIFQKIRIVGALGEDSGLIVLDLSKHVHHTNALVNVDGTTNQPKDNDVSKHMRSYLDSADTTSEA